MILPLNHNQQVLATVNGKVTVAFQIINAVLVTDIRWYYTACPPTGTPNFNSSAFQDITELMNRTSDSTLTLSSDRLNLTIDRLVSTVDAVAQTDQGRYYICAVNSAGYSNNYVDILVRGKISVLINVHNEFIFFFAFRTYHTNR